LGKVDVVGGGESPRRGKVEEDGSVEDDGSVEKRESVGKCRSGSRRCACRENGNPWRILNNM
jgi:hypothetical protein